MLHLDVPNSEYYNESSNEFITKKGGILVIEHSLISLSKWESMYHKPFMDTFNNKVLKKIEYIDYIKSMTINKVNDEIYYNLNNECFDKINAYINNPMTATWFNNNDVKASSNTVITSELIYYWMTVFNIPFECEKWHINRLLTLIRICMIKNSPEKKMSKQDIYAQQRALNEKRRAQMKSKG